MKNRHFNNLGSAILEMLVFTPLALLFLFVAIDGGLSLSEKAALSDALRAGLNEERLVTIDASPLSYTSSLSADVSYSALADFSTQIAQAVSDNVVRTADTAVGADLLPYRVTIVPVVLTIDPASGALLQYQPATPRYAPAGVQFELEQTVPEYPYVDRADFISNELNTILHERPSRYALPLGNAYSLTSSSQTPRFLNHSILLYAEVEGLTRQINKNYVRSILGKFYAVQQQQLHFLKSQLP